MKQAAIFGTSGAIGSALANHFARTDNWQVHAFSRSHSSTTLPNLHTHQINYLDEAALHNHAQDICSQAPLDLIIVATGILHQNHIQPEKALHMLTAESLNYIFQVNTIIPALIAKHFTPKLNRNQRSHLAFLTARAGSISDNQMGGWHAYRASKAALNMLAKNIAIEFARKNKHAIISLIHPGVVDSELSKPFSRNIPADKLTQPAQAAQKIATLLDQIPPESSGQIHELNGEIVAP